MFLPPGGGFGSRLSVQVGNGSEQGLPQEEAQAGRVGLQVGAVTSG